jgi:hypothetical protein
MEFNEITIAYIINLIGFVFLLTGYFFVSKDHKVGFLFSFIGAVFLSVGSFILEAYAIVVLDLIWAILSIDGLIFYNKQKEPLNKKNNIGILSLLIFFSINIVFFLCNASTLEAVILFLLLGFTGLLFLLFSLGDFLLQLFI